MSEKRTPIVRTDAYATDLAFIHDQGWADFGRRSAPGLLTVLRRNAIARGKVVDLGCGSGIWARALCDAGYPVVGVDISPAMIELARQRVPEAELHVASCFDIEIPACRAVTALGEVFNYLFDSKNSLTSLRRVCQKIYAALTPGGLLIFDVAEPGRAKGHTQAFKEGDGWACLVELRHDVPNRQLARRIITFRKIGDSYRRHEETHRQQLYPGATVSQMLRKIGFRVRMVRRYGEYTFPKKLVGVIARKPGG
jgi:SAM-dependent methyltransferase